jgi:hypothetical protein
VKHCFKAKGEYEHSSLAQEEFNESPQEASVSESIGIELNRAAIVLADKLS